jgi:hypothetical protein
MLKIGLPFAFALALFAETTIGDFSPWANLTALGIVGVVLIYIVTKLLPSLYEKFVRQTELHVEAQKAQQASFTAVIDAMHARAHEDYQALAVAIGALQRHCASQLGKTE